MLHSRRRPFVYNRDDRTYCCALIIDEVTCLSGAEFFLISPMRATQLPQSQIESSITFYAICSDSAANSRIGSGADPLDLPRPARFERPRAPRKEIRSKPLRSLNSGPRKQVITGEDREAATISGINGVFTEGVKAESLPGA